MPAVGFKKNPHENELPMMKIADGCECQTFFGDFFCRMFAENFVSPKYFPVFAPGTAKDLCEDSFWKKQQKQEKMFGEAGN